MALLKRFEFTILNAAGEPVNGCSVEVRKQGATANAGGSLTTVAVHHVGAIVAGDTVAIDTGVSTVLVNSVAGPSPMQVVVASAVTVVNDVSRLTPTGLPTIYNDADGVESKANPLLTDTNGYAFCYAPYDFVDALIAATNAGSAPSGPAKLRLAYDQGGQGDGTNVSSVIDSNGAITAFIYNTIRTLGNASSKIFSLQNNSIEKCSLDLNGRFTTSGGIQTTGSGSVIFGNTGGIQSSTGLNISGGTVVLPSGSITTAMLAQNSVHPAPVTTVGSAADATPGTSETVRITTSYTAVALNTGVRVNVNLPYTINGGINTGGRVELRLYIGGVLKAVGFIGGVTGANEIFNNQGNISFTWEEPTMAASPTTIEVRDIRVDTAGTTVATYKGTIFAGYMTIQELKR